MAPAVEKVSVTVIRTPLQPTCSTRISISPFTFFPWKYLALWRKGRHFWVRMQTASPFLPSPKGLISPRGGYPGTFSTNVLWHDHWFPQYLCVLCERQGRVLMGELETQVLVLPRYLTFLSLCFILTGRNEYLYAILLRVILRIKWDKESYINK